MMLTQKSPLPKLHAVKGTAVRFVAGNRPLHFERRTTLHANRRAVKRIEICAIGAAQTKRKGQPEGWPRHCYLIGRPVSGAFCRYHPEA